MHDLPKRSSPGRSGEKPAGRVGESSSLPEHIMRQNNVRALSMPPAPPPIANSSLPIHHLEFTQAFPYDMDYGPNTMSSFPAPSPCQSDFHHKPYDHDRTYVPPGVGNDQGCGSSQAQRRAPHTALQYRIGQNILYHGQAAPSLSGSPPSPRDSSIDPDELTVLEDKRQRNTAASARFRTKKKQRSLNLERTVSDLTGRAKELEREAINLRQENTWLKEIVIMKGRQNMAAAMLTPNEEHNPKATVKGQSTSEDSDTDSEARRRKEKEKRKTKGKDKA